MFRISSEHPIRSMASRHFLFFRPVLKKNVGSPGPCLSLPSTLERACTSAFPHRPGSRAPKTKNSYTQDHGSHPYVEDRKGLRERWGTAAQLPSELRNRSVWGAGDNRNEALSATTTTAVPTRRSYFFYPRCPRPSSRAFLFSTRSAPRGIHREARMQGADGALAQASAYRPLSRPVRSPDIASSSL